MPLTQLSDTELSETLTRAKEIAVHGGGPSVAQAEYDAYLHAAEEMGVPREAMLQALRERQLVSGETLEVGQRVFAPSADGFWYVAELLSISGMTARVRFLESGEHTCAFSDLRPLTLIPGRKLQAEVKDWGWYGCKVMVQNSEDETVQVMHDDFSSMLEWVSVRQLRLSKLQACPKEEDTRASGKATLTRWVVAATGFGLVAGMLLDRLLPVIFPFLR